MLYIASSIDENVDYNMAQALERPGPGFVVRTDNGKAQIELGEYYSCWIYPSSHKQSLSRLVAKFIRQPDC